MNDKGRIIRDNRGIMAMEDRNFTHLTLRERIVEQPFNGDVLRTLAASA